MCSLIRPRVRIVNHNGFALQKWAERLFLIWILLYNRQLLPDTAWEGKADEAVFEIAVG